MSAKALRLAPLPFLLAAALFSGAAVGAAPAYADDAAYRAVASIPFTSISNGVATDSWGDSTAGGSTLYSVTSGSARYLVTDGATWSLYSSSGGRLTVKAVEQYWDDLNEDYGSDTATGSAFPLSGVSFSVSLSDAVYYCESLPSSFSGAGYDLRRVGSALVDSDGYEVYPEDKRPSGDGGDGGGGDDQGGGSDDGGDPDPDGGDPDPDGPPASSDPVAVTISELSGLGLVQVIGDVIAVQWVVAVLLCLVVGLLVFICFKPVRRM